MALLAAYSDDDLAATLSVNRRRIAKMRADGAPESLDLPAWLGWLRGTGRSALALRLAERIGSQAALPADPPPAHDLPQPADDAEPAAIERHWRTLERQAKAEAASLQAAQLRGELVRVDSVRDLAADLVGVVVEQLDRPWLALQPYLTQLGPEQVRGARRDYLAAIRDARAHATRALPTILRRLRG